MLCISGYCRWEDKVKPSIKACTSAFFKASTTDSTGAQQKVLVKDHRSGKWMPRSGLQWQDVHDAARAYLYKQSEDYTEGKTMPKSWTTTGLLVTPPLLSIIALTVMAAANPCFCRFTPYLASQEASVGMLGSLPWSTRRTA